MFTQHRGQTRARHETPPQTEPSDHPNYTVREIDEHEGDLASNDAFDAWEAELKLARTRRKILNLQAKAHELTHQPPAPKEATPDTEATHAMRIETLQRQLAAAIRKRDRHITQAEHDERLAGKVENSANKVRELEKKLQQLQDPQQPAPRARKSVTPPSAKLSRLERLQCDLLTADAAAKSANQALAQAKQKGKFGTILQRCQDRADRAAATVTNLHNAIIEESDRIEKVAARRSRGPIEPNDALPAPRTPLQRIEDRLQALIPKRTALIQKLEAHASEPEFAAQAAAEQARLAEKAAHRKAVKGNSAEKAEAALRREAIIRLRDALRIVRTHKESATVEPKEVVSSPIEKETLTPSHVQARPASSICLQEAEVEPLVKQVLDILNPAPSTPNAPRAPNTSPAIRPQTPQDEAVVDEDRERAWTEKLREHPGKNPGRDI